MDLIRLKCSAASTLLVLGSMLASPPSAGAQPSFELGGGWNYPGAAPTGERFGHGFNARLSVGLPISPRFGFRVDLMTAQFDDSLQVYLPCVFPGCTGPSYLVNPTTVGGLTANWLLNVDSRGIVYLIGGGGAYYFVQYREGRNERGFAVGASAGAGLAVPIGKHVRGFVEARYHQLFDNTVQPQGLAPVTFGLRF